MLYPRKVREHRQRLPAQGMRPIQIWVPDVMVDKVTTVPKSPLGQCIGRLADDDLLRLNRSLLVFLCSCVPGPGPLSGVHSGTARPLM